MKRTNAVGLAVFFAGLFGGAQVAWGSLKGEITTYGVVMVILAALAVGFGGLAAFYQKSTETPPPPPSVSGAPFVVKKDDSPHA